LKSVDFSLIYYQIFRISHPESNFAGKKGNKAIVVCAQN
jgi:hypothetical protein